MPCESDSYFKMFCDQCRDGSCRKKRSRPKKSICFNPMCRKKFLKTCGAQLFCCIECQRASELGAAIEELSESVRLENERLVKERLERERGENERRDAEKAERRKNQLRRAHAKHRQTEHGKEMHRLDSKRRYDRQKEARHLDLAVSRDSESNDESGEDGPAGNIRHHPAF